MTATATRATITMPTDRTIHVERIFNASRDRVWRAFGMNDGFVALDALLEREP